MKLLPSVVLLLMTGVLKGWFNMENEKELTKVPGLPLDEVVIIKKLGYGSLTTLRSKSTNASLNAVNGSVNASIDLGEYSKWIIVFGVKEASFFKNCRTTAEKVAYIENDKLPSETGEYLFKEIQRLNNFDGVEETKKK